MADLTFSIPDNHIPKLVTMFDFFQGRIVSINARFPETPKEWSTIIEYDIPAKNGAETQLQYGKRFIAEVIKGFLNYVEKNKAEENLRETISQIVIQPEQLPDDIIQ